MALYPHPDELETLLASITALANCLKQCDHLPRGGKFPHVGKNILGTLALHGPQTVPQLARLYATSRQNIQMAVNILVGERCLVLTNNPAHQRSKLVTLTNTGQSRLRSAAEHEATFLAPIAEHITEKEIRSALNLIARLRALLEGRSLPEIKLMPVLPGGFLPPRPPRVHPKPKPTPPIAPVAPIESAAGDELPFNLL